METKKPGTALTLDAAREIVVQHEHYSPAEIKKAAQIIKKDLDAKKAQKINLITDAYSESYPAFPNLSDLVAKLIDAYEEIYTEAWNYSDLEKRFSDLCREINTPVGLSQIILNELNKDLPVDEFGDYCDFVSQAKSDWMAEESRIGIDPAELHESNSPTPERVKRYNDAFRSFLKDRDTALNNRLSSIFQTQINVTACRTANNSTGRQSHAARRPSARKRGDGEPPHRRLLTEKQSNSLYTQLAADDPAEQSLLPLQLYDYGAFAALGGCARQTIYNLVSQGKLSKPIQTLAGPRFTVHHYLEFIGQAPRPTPPPRPDKPAAPQQKRPRGRPRIAAQAMGKGGTQ